MTTVTAKNRYLATFLSMFAPGLGHVYAGRVVQGLSLAGGTVAVAMLSTVSILATPSIARVTLVCAAAGWQALWVIAAVGAFRSAGSAPPAPAAGASPRWYVYVVIAMLTTASFMAWSGAVRTQVAEVFRVPSRSMAPAIRPGARVIVDKLAYQVGPVRRGDIVVFINPNERYQRYVKRVIGLPGDTVEMRGDDVLVNGAILPHAGGSPGTAESRVVEETNGDARYRIVLTPSRDSESASPLAPVQVPNGHCFLLGDNRAGSIDSRQIGPVPLADVLGRVARVW